MFGYQRAESAENAPISFGSVAYTVLSIAIPMALSYTFSATVVVANVMGDDVPGNKQEHLAASALIMPTLTTLFSIGVATIFSMNFYTNKRRGALEARKKLLEEQGADPKQDSEIQKLQGEISGVLKAGLIFGLPSIPLPMAVMFFSGWLLEHAFGQNHELAEQAQGFLRPYAFALIAFAVRIAEEQIAFSFEKQKWVMSLALASFAIGAGCAYVMGFGTELTRAMGLPGIAYGFVIESYLTAALFGAILYSNKSFKEFNFFKELLTPYRAEDGARIRELARRGFPTLAITISQVTAPFVINMIAGRLGTEALAAQSFSSWLLFGLLILQLALGQAVNQEMNRKKGAAKEQVSQARERGEDLGSEAYINASRVARSGLAIAGLSMSALCVTVMAYPKLIIDITGSPNTDNPAVISMAETAMRITAVGVILDTLCNAMVQTLGALDDNIMPMAISITTLWAGVGISALLALKAELGVAGLATGYVAGNAVGGALLLLRFLTRTEPSALAALDSHAPIAVAPTAVEMTPKLTNLCWRASAEASTTTQTPLLLDVDVPQP